MIKIKPTCVFLICSILMTSFASAQSDVQPSEEVPSDVAATSDFNLSGTLSLTSDYRFRGISQNDEKIAPQLGLELGHESGAFVGIWASSVDFGDGNEASAEIDFSAGYRHDYESWSFDGQLLYYYYPKADPSLNYNYAEAIFAASYDFTIASVGSTLAYSPDFFADSGEAIYLQAHASAPITGAISTQATLGKQYVEKNDVYGLPDIIDWSLSVDYTYDESILLNLSYIDTNATQSECGDNCSPRFVATISYQF